MQRCVLGRRCVMKVLRCVTLCTSVGGKIAEKQFWKSACYVDREAEYVFAIWWWIISINLHRFNELSRNGVEVATVLSVRVTSRSFLSVTSLAPKGFLRLSNLLETSWNHILVSCHICVACRDDILPLQDVSGLNIMNGNTPFETRREHF